MLYLSYDGALEPLGQSQVVPYLRGLAGLGAAITLISFEKRHDLRALGRVAALSEQLARHGIRWIPLAYHKRPSVPATLYDVAAGVAHGARVVRRERIEIVHARSYVAGLMAWLLKRVFGLWFLFDMRGFWADERVEAGLWPAGGAVYRAVKRLERRLFADADEIVTLADRGRRILAAWPGIDGGRVTVIPTCVDLERFPQAVRPAFRPARTAPVLAYTGSVGTWDLLPEMLEFFRETLRRFPAARFMILTRNPGEAMRAVERAGLASAAVTIETVGPEAIPARLAHVDVGLALHKPGFARQASCPTKTAEYLAMGLPVVTNDAVGDMETIIGARGVGVVLSEFSSSTYAAALDRLEGLWADPALPDRCRQVAEDTFSLELGVSRYWSIYQRLSSSAVGRVEQVLR